MAPQTSCFKAEKQLREHPDAHTEGNSVSEILRDSQSQSSIVAASACIHINLRPIQGDSVVKCQPKN